MNTCDCCGTSVPVHLTYHEGQRKWCGRCAKRDDREECARSVDLAQVFEEMPDREDVDVE